jgi:ATP-dependent DNA helicase RecG
LENLLLLHGRHLKNAGVLLFCKNVRKFFGNATIMCVLFQGKENVKILDSREFDADLYSNYQNAFSYLESKLNTEYIIKGGPRIEKLELPPEALREAILNAIAHRNYFSGALIQIHIFSDRVEITNPGGLAGGMQLADLGYKSMPRNFLLFGLMQRMDLAEKAGTGIKRINDAMKEYGLERPRFEANETWFTITFRRPDLQKSSFEGRTEVLEKVRVKVLEKLGVRLGEKLGVRLGENEARIFQLIGENNQITIPELAQALHISSTAVENNLAKLKSKGLLKRIGPDKGGSWELVKR